MPVNLNIYIVQIVHEQQHLNCPVKILRIFMDLYVFNSKI